MAVGTSPAESGVSRGGSGGGHGAGCAGQMQEGSRPRSLLAFRGSGAAATDTDRSAGRRSPFHARAARAERGGAGRPRPIVGRGRAGSAPRSAGRYRVRVRCRSVSEPRRAARRGIGVALRVLRRSSLPPIPALLGAVPPPPSPPPALPPRHGGCGVPHRRCGAPGGGARAGPRRWERGGGLRDAALPSPWQRRPVRLDGARRGASPVATVGDGSAGGPCPAVPVAVG